MNIKHPNDSLVITNELVLPNDTNPYNNLMGGRLLHLMDVAAAISAQTHCNRIVVTVSVDNVSFRHPIKLGDVVTIKAMPTRSFNTSIEVHLLVWAQNIPSGTKVQSNEAYYTFVALDETECPVTIPKLVPQTDYEKKLWESALHRRQLRLILQGKMKPEEARELKTLFF